jgi:hypothetical protein
MKNKDFFAVLEARKSKIKRPASGDGLLSLSADHGLQKGKEPQHSHHTHKKERERETLIRNQPLR